MQYPCISTDCTGRADAFLQWEIYDAYVEELQKQERNKEKHKAQSMKKEEEKSRKKTAVVETQVGCADFTGHYNRTDKN